MKSKPLELVWLEQPEEHNYAAAISYLSLFTLPKKARKIVSKLRKAPIEEFRAKDIFRASTLSLLGISNSHVKHDQKKIRSGSMLSPILLLRDEVNCKVVVCDGYHRLCAIYSFREDANIRCKIV